MVLNSQEDIAVSWEVANGEEACRQLEEHPVDVILMDVQMPVLNGIAATERIVRSGIRGPQGDPTRVVVLTTFDNDEYVFGAVQAGASGFLLKDSEPEELLQAVRTVGDQAAVVSPAATAKLFKRMRTGGHTPPAKATPRDINGGLIDPLTPREVEILERMALGMSNTEIAQELFISLPTVKTHVRHVLSKTNSRDRVQAVLFAFQRGLVTKAQLLALASD